jgi:hypothetical protein
MRTLVSLLQWRTLAGAFNPEAPFAVVPGSIRLSSGSGEIARAGRPEKESGVASGPILEVATPPARALSHRARRGETRRSRSEQILA